MSHDLGEEFLETCVTRTWLSWHLYVSSSNHVIKTLGRVVVDAQRPARAAARGLARAAARRSSRAAAWGTNWGLFGAGEKAAHTTERRHYSTI